MNHDFGTDPRFAGLRKPDHRILLASPTMHGEEEKYVHAAFEDGWSPPRVLI